MKADTSDGASHGIALAVAAILLGAALVALPWMCSTAGAPAALPEVLLRNDPLIARLKGVAKLIDDACARGDIDALRARLTEGCLAETREVLAGAGQLLEPGALRAQRQLIGALEALPMVHGAGAGSRVVLVFLRVQPRADAPREQRSLFALRFERGDGGVFRLDAKRSRLLEHREDVVAAARAWADELLES